MKFTPLTLLSIVFAVVGASPVPKIEWVTVTAYTTVVFGQGNADATESAAPVATETVSSETQANFLNFHLDAASTSATPVTSAEAVSSATSAAETVPEVATVSASAANVDATSTSSTASTADSTASATSTASGSTFSGEGTYYSTGLGACGETSVDTDYIVAISHELFDQYTPNGNPNKNTLCGKKIQASYEGKSVEVTVVDRCEGCAYYDLDFSPSAFADIADMDLGRIDITWDWA